MPHNVDCFVEDEGHRLVVGFLIQRLFAEANVPIRVNFRNAVGGRPRVFRSLGTVLRGMRNGELRRPDVLVVAIDANCKKYGPIKSLIDETIAGGSASAVIRAIPDPHIERWLRSSGVLQTLLQGAGHVVAPVLNDPRFEYVEAEGERRGPSTARRRRSAQDDEEGG